MVALLLTKINFWSAKARKILNFSWCIQVLDLVLKYCSGKNKGIWIDFFFLFFLLLIKNVSWNAICFFDLLYGSWLKFSSIALLVKRFQMRSKPVLNLNGLILFFFQRNMHFLSSWYLHGLRFAMNAQMLFFFDELKSFQWSVWGLL